jgi:hypothetical protein
MAEAAIFLEAYWEQRQTDVSKCRVCKDHIYSDMFVFVIETPKLKEDIARVCQSCFTEMNIEEWRQE